MTIGEDTNEEQEPRQVPKSEWGEGPWQSEPDRFEWVNLFFESRKGTGQRGPSGRQGRFEHTGQAAATRLPASEA